MKPADLDVDPDELRLRTLLDELRQAVDGVAELIPAAIDAQWSAAPVARPREDTSERAKGLRSDPTADVVTDPDRLLLRTHILHTVRVVRAAGAALRGARSGLAQSLEPWQGVTGA